MSAYDDDISHAVLETIRDEVRHVHGLSVDNAERTGLILEITGTGWSPTLHAMRLRWQIDLWKTEGVDHKALAKAKDRNAVLAILAPARDVIADVVRRTQAPRARLAPELGIHEPRRLPRDTSTMTPREIDRQVDIRHVMVDPVAVDLLERWHARQGLPCEPADQRRELVASLVDLHAEECDDGPAIRGVDARGMAVTLRDGPDGGRLQPLQPFTFGEEPAFDGRFIWHDSLMPETVIMQAPGRTVREVVDTGTTLDGRIITCAGISDKRTYIGVECVDSRLDHIL
jgi:hypothetical protein